MANRTFKVYGQAYAASGDVSVVLNVGGVEVFNGAVSDSTTVREGAPTVENLLFQFEMDEEVQGGQSYSLTVAGGELCLGQTYYNGISAYVISRSWFEENVTDANNVSAAAQAHIANTLGAEKLGADLHSALLAGTVTAPTAEQNAVLATANLVSKDWTVFSSANDTRTGAAINGESIDGWTDVATNMGHWPILEDGAVFTCTWNIDPSTSSLA